MDTLQGENILRIPERTGAFNDAEPVNSVIEAGSRR